jgi:hypothetical protein
MFLGITADTQMNECCRKFSEIVPVFIVLGAMKIQKIFQQFGGCRQLGIQHLGEQILLCCKTGNIKTAFEKIVRKKLRFFNK